MKPEAVKGCSFRSEVSGLVHQRPAGRLFDRWRLSAPRPPDPVRRGATSIAYWPFTCGSSPWTCRLPTSSTLRSVHGVSRIVRSWSRRAAFGALLLRVVVLLGRSGCLRLRSSMSLWRDPSHGCHSETGTPPRAAGCAQQGPCESTTSHETFFRTNRLARN